MKNIEKYEKEISKLVNEDNILPCAIATVAGIRKEKPCYHQECEECHKKCIEWMYSEYKEEILSDDEKEIVKAMCDFAHKCGRDVIYVCKYLDILKGVYIYFDYKNEEISITDTIESPWLSKHMFKGMENGRKYTLEELGITCPTQKDN